jgi:diguanylate cyclase (GGDEF)-like protein
MASLPDSDFLLPGLRDILRIARDAGISGDGVPTMEAVERRRLQLWGLALLMLVSSIVVFLALTSELGVNYPWWLPEAVVKASVAVLVPLFGLYAIEKELKLRRLERLLLASRAQSLSLVNLSRDIGVLLEAARALNGNLDIEEVLRTIVHCAGRMLKGQHTELFLVQGDRRLAQVLVDEPRTVAFGEGLVGKVARKRQPIMISTQDAGGATEDGGSVRGVIGLPLLHHDVLLGVLRVKSRPGNAYSREDMHLFSLFAEQAATAIANAQALQDHRFDSNRRHHQLMHDSGTGLPSRFFVLERLDQMLGGGSQSKDRALLMTVGLDSFSRVNEAFGFPVGDEVLNEVGARIRAVCGREMTVARFAFDEFSVLGLMDDSESEVRAHARRIQEAIREPMELQSGVIRLSAGIGIAIQAGAGDTAQSMSRNSMIALNAARRRGPGEIEMFKPAMFDAAFRRLSLETDVVRAVQRGEFDVFYQPIVDLRSRHRVVAVEALLRWWHPERGLLDASAFVPFVHELGQLAEIDMWVLKRVATMSRELNQASCPVPIHFNVPPAQLHGQRYFDTMGEFLASLGDDAGNLVLEITEHDLLLDSAYTVDRLFYLKRFGLRFAIDDFGTGFSSLAYLNRLPLDIVKIDKSFVSRLVTVAAENRLVSSIIQLCRGLGMEVIAEGVEDGRQLDILAELDCHLVQGMVVGGPIQASDLVQRLRRQNRADSR